MSGIGRYLKEKNPAIQLVGVDPVGSLYYDYFHSGLLTQPHTYILEGIGEDFLPSTMDFQYVDDVVRVNDRECFQTTRRLVREEGLYCGGSSGAAVAGALRYLRRREASRDLVAVVLLPDGAGRYMSKIFNDNWMTENGFMDPDRGLGTVSDLVRARPSRELISVSPDAHVAQVIGVLKMHGISQVPVIADGKLHGILAETRLLEQALRGSRTDTRVGDLIEATYCTVRLETEVSVLIELFRRSKVAIVLDEENRPVDIITKIDLIDYISVSGSAV